MRITVWILILCSSLLQAAEVSIKTLSTHGKTSYLIYAGSFSSQSNAEHLKTQLAPLTHEPINIEYIQRQKLYLVEVGPVNTYPAAQAVQQKILAPRLVHDVQIDPPLHVNDTPHSSSSIEEVQSALAQIPTLKPSAPVLTSPLEAAMTSAPEPNETTTSKIWNLRNANIRAVIAEVSRITSKNFIIDPRVQGKISIISGSPMSNDELYQVFLSMLQVSGFAAIPSGDIIKIIPALDAKTQASDQSYSTGHRPEGDDMMVQVIPVKYVPAEQLVPVLRPLMPQSSNVSAYSASNMLILSGQASNIKQLSRIIRQVDTSSANGIDMVPLKHALAMDVVTILKDLIKSQPNVSATNQTSIAADDRSNAILLSGNKTERIKLRLLIAQLDRVNPNGDSSNTQVIYLNYLRAEDLVPILTGIAQANFTGVVGSTIGTITRPALDSTNPASNMPGSQASGQVSTGPTPSNPPGGTAPANAQNEGSTKPTVQIIAEPNTNSVIINAPATLIRTLKKVISQLDILPAQLLIEALVAEINESDFNNLGIEWGSVDQTTKKPDTFKAGFAIINSKTSIDQFQAQIYALARDQRANILSTPSVVVLDNRQAKILIGKQVSVASSSYPNNAGGTAASGSPFTTFDRVNVALHLYVRPQITRDRGIQLQIDQGNDTLAAGSTLDPGPNPTFNISSIVTSVHVESGDVIVLGGLSQDSLGNDSNKLPILGDIPGLGKLFKRNFTSREKKVLMVFIRPCILRTEKDSQQATNGKYNNVRQTELNFVRNEDFNPANQNTVLQPLKTAELPRPFTRPPRRPNLLMKSK